MADREAVRALFARGDVRELFARGDARELGRLLARHSVRIHVTVKDKHGTTVLHVAAAWGHLAFAESLLQKGANVKARNNRGETALYMAAQKRRVNLAAAEENHLAVAELLLEKGADVNAEDNKGDTALYVAAQNRHLDFVELLLKKGADVNARNKKGDTALYAAVQEGHSDAAKLLLGKRADVNARNSGGNTALHVAMKEDRLDIVRLLLKKGANVNAKDDSGRTALYVALWMNKKAMADLLLEHGAVAVIADNEGLTPLVRALRPQEGEPDVALICKMLLPSGELVELAQDGLEAHGKRQKGIARALVPAVQNLGFLTDLADALAGIDASGCAAGTGMTLKALLQQLDAFAFVKPEVVQNGDNRCPVVGPAGPPRTMAVPRTAAMPRTAEEEEDRRAIIRKQINWLLILHHASTCKAPGETCTEMQNCQLVRELWNHVLNCKDPNCQKPRCSLCRQLLLHHQKCTNERCALCVPVRKALLHQRKQRAKKGQLSREGAQQKQPQQMGALCVPVLNSLAHQRKDGDFRVVWAPRRLGLGDAYEERRARHRLAVVQAVRIPAFMSDLAEGLAGVSTFESDPGAPKKLVAAAQKLDELAG